MTYDPQRSLDEQWRNRNLRNQDRFYRHPIVIPIVSAAIGIVALVLVICGIAFGSQSLEFWLQNNNAAHQVTLQRLQTKQTQESLGVQDGLETDIGNKIGTIETETLQIKLMSPADRSTFEAERLQFTQQVCIDADQLNSGTELPLVERRFIAVHCTAGAANPSAPY